VRVRPDIIFVRRRLVVFIDGCFWHSCPEHGTRPRFNEAYWVPKLRHTVTRDQVVVDALREHGWRVLRIWEHDKVSYAVRLVEAALLASPPGSRP